MMTLVGPPIELDDYRRAMDELLRPERGIHTEKSEIIAGFGFRYTQPTNVRTGSIAPDFCGAAK
jgi:hypothetical protein